MRSRHALFAILVAVVAGLAGSAWLHARAMMVSDDRPPIVVRGGSIYFEGGDKDDPARCCNNWKKDLFSDEWKPDPDNKSGVRDYAVTVTGVPSTVCSMSEVMGKEVLVYFQYGADRNRNWSLYRLNVQAKHGIGKREPKLVPPGVHLTVKNSTDPKLPGILEDERPGFISGIRVGSAACGFDESHRPSLVIRIQPKSDQP
jgi:hypothetical protein